jgi:carboxypeptidase Q
VVWVNEENGAAGGVTYSQVENITKHSFLSECDSGAFQPYGIGVSCLPSANCDASIAQLTTLGQALLGSIGSGNVTAGGDGTDIEPSCATGVVCAGFEVLDPRLTGDTNNPCMADSMGAWTQPTFSVSNIPYDSQYFWVHHSQADTMERMDPRQLNHVAAASAIWAYSIAQLPELLPRDAPSPSPAPSSPSSTAPRIGIIVGGAAIAAVVAAAAGFFYRRRVAASASSAPAYSTLSAAAGSEPFSAP